MRRQAAFAVLTCCLGAATAAAQTPPPSGAQFERPIKIDRPGPQKVEVDLPLLAASRQRTAGTARTVEPPLAGLRLISSSGDEIPYLVFDQPDVGPPWIAGAVLAIPETKRSSGFEVDLGASYRVDGLQIDGLPAPFLKRLRLEGSGDRQRWTVLLGDATVFDLPNERVRLTTLTFLPGAYRYLRATWDDTNSARVPLPIRANAREALLTQPPPPVRSAIPFEREASEPGRSRYRIRLPAAGLPVAAVLIRSSAGDIFRTATVLESRFGGSRADPVELGRTRLVRTSDAPQDPNALRIPISFPQSAELQLVVDDGQNPPLDIHEVLAELGRRQWIYFEARGGPVTARYGGRAAAPPQYDLEARRSSIDIDRIAETAWGEPPGAGATEAAAPPPPLPERGAQIDVGGFRFRRSIPDDPSGLVSLQLDAAVLSRSAGPGSAFGDVRIVDREGYQIPYLVERRDEPLSIELTLTRKNEPVRGLPPPSTGTRSTYTTDLPFDGLPQPRLVLETSDRVFSRRVQVGLEREADRKHRDGWFELLATAEWVHADRQTAARALELRIEPRDHTRLVVIVDEGDNRPLTMSSARLLLPSWRLRFFKPNAPLQLVYGRDKAMIPQYDLALLAPAVMSAAAREIAPAAETDTVGTADVMSPRYFWIGLAAAAVVLLGLIVRLISSGTAPPPSPPAP
jgi:hypothetical protein